MINLISKSLAILINKKAITDNGGVLAPPHHELLESALSRPENKIAYDDYKTIYDLAAAYGFGLTKNHCFVDGNKRTALMTIDIFLKKNNYIFNPSEHEAVEIIIEVATDQVSELELSKWIEINSKSEN